MSTKTSSVTEPLLEGIEDGGESKGRWWKKVLDIEEAKNQCLFSLPMILTNVCYYCIPLVSVMFAGHLSQLELAGATLANSWATVTGFAFMDGLSGALETLCGQGFGAKLYKILGIYLQASCIISFLFSIAVSVIWFYAEPILCLLGQDPRISMTAAIYLKYLIPGLVAYGFLQNILRFLQTQSAVTPMVLFSLLPLLIHIGIAYTLVHSIGLGFRGAPLAASISLWISVVMLAMYVHCAKRFAHTWNGFSFESFHYIRTDLKVALPSAAMVCLEYWAVEVLVFLAGLVPNSEIATSLIAMCSNTETVAYMLSSGLSAAASTRVSNELGAGNPGRAKSATAVTLKLSVVLGLSFVLVLGMAHSLWAGLFSDSMEINRDFASMVPLLAISIMLDAVQCVLSGVTRGCGWQHLAVYANMGTFCFIGIPIAYFTGFRLKLHVKGLWIGFICGLFCQAGSLSVITLLRKWSRTDIFKDSCSKSPGLV